MILALALLTGTISFPALAMGAPPDNQTVPESASPAPERPGTPPPALPGGAEWGPERIAPPADLHLSVAQRQKMLEIRQNFEKAAQPLRFLIEQEQLRLEQLWSEANLDERAITDREIAIATNRVKIRILERTMIAQIDSVLTPEQLSQMKEKKEDRIQPRPDGPESHGPDRQ